MSLQYRFNWIRAFINVVDLYQLLFHANFVFHCAVREWRTTVCMTVTLAPGHRNLPPRSCMGTSWTECHKVCMCVCVYVVGCHLHIREKFEGMVHR